MELFDVPLGHSVNAQWLGSILGRMSPSWMELCVKEHSLFSLIKVYRRHQPIVAVMMATKSMLFWAIDADFT